MRCEIMVIDAKVVLGAGKYEIEQLRDDRWYVRNTDTKRGSSLRNGDLRSLLDHLTVEYGDRRWTCRSRFELTETVYYNPDHRRRAS